MAQIRFVDLFEQLTLRWKPRRKDGWHERDYSDNLIRYLKKHIDCDQIDRSRMVGVRRADLLLVRRLDGVVSLSSAKNTARPPLPYEEMIAVEVKLDLRTQRELERLEGQIYDYLQALDTHARLVVLLLGRTNDDYVRKLRLHSERTRRDDPIFYTSRRMRVVEISF